ncbi:DUF7695 domain-containing protein [Anaerocolumna sp. AGMB13020]
MCGNEIKSKSVHDFATCSCSVNGGLEYLRRWLS